MRHEWGTKVDTKRFPSLAKEGWTRPQENIAKPPCWERTGWLVQTTDNRWLEPTTPSARANVASRNLLDRAATPPYPRRGIRRVSSTCGCIKAVRKEGMLFPASQLKFSTGCLDFEHVPARGW